MMRSRLWIGAALLGLASLAAVARRRGVGHPPDVYTAHGFTRRALTTPAGTMTYYEAGQGQPLVFLHGIGGGASSWMWSKVAPAFTGRGRVIVPDWVGWGDSDHPRRFLLFADYAAGLETLLAQLDRPAVLVAQSLSAGFAIEAARRLPGQVRALIMTTPSGGLDFGEDKFGPVVRRTFTPIARSPLRTAFYRLVFPRRLFLRWWTQTSGFGNPAGVSDEIVQSWQYSARKAGAEYSALPFLTGELRYDLAPYLRDLTLPAVMLWGADERQIGTATARRFAALNPDVPLEWVPRARNTFELEWPAQTTALIGRWLDRLAPDSANLLEAHP